MMGVMQGSVVLDRELSDAEVVCGHLLAECPVRALLARTSQPVVPARDAEGADAQLADAVTQVPHNSFSIHAPACLMWCRVSCCCPQSGREILCG